MVHRSGLTDPTCTAFDYTPAAGIPQPAICRCRLQAPGCRAAGVVYVATSFRVASRRKTWYTMITPFPNAPGGRTIPARKVPAARGSFCPPCGPKAHRGARFSILGPEPTPRRFPPRRSANLHACASPSPPRRAHQQTVARHDTLDLPSGRVLQWPRAAPNQRYARATIAFEGRTQRSLA